MSQTGVVKPLPVLDTAPTATPCCAPLDEAPLAAEDAVRLAGLLKSLADPTRLRLLSLIASAPEGEICQCELTGPLGVSQPTVSHHLKLLLEAGLVAREKRGVWAYYRSVPGALDGLARLITAGVG